MPVNIEFETRGKFLVSIVALGKLFGKRFLLYTKTAGQEESWALRDYQHDLILRSDSSPLLASDIEQKISHSVRPPHRSTAQKVRWSQELKRMAEEHYGRNHVEDAAPADAPAIGRWRKMSSSGR